MIEIAVINASTVVKDEDAQKAVAALQVQVTRDFAPYWGVDAHLSFVPQSQAPAPGTWWLTILDDSDQAGALGYHDVTPEGLPIGKVFAKSDITYGLQWTVTASHELLEMLGDPAINLTVLEGHTLYAYEVCDACEADQYGYQIDGVLVSDFVTPAWFESFRQAGTVFDYRWQIRKAFQLLSGGYIGYMDITSVNGWQQRTYQSLKYIDRPRPGSRRERRRTARDQWQVSDLRQS